MSITRFTTASGGVYEIDDNVHSTDMRKVGDSTTLSLVHPFEWREVVLLKARTWPHEDEPTAYEEIDPEDLRPGMQVLAYHSFQMGDFTRTSIIESIEND